MRVDGLLVTIVVLIALILGMAFYTASHPSALTKETPGQTMDIRTLKHDGHLFIVFSTGGLLHHPDCPCGWCPKLMPLERLKNMNQMGGGK